MTPNRMAMTTRRSGRRPSVPVGSTTPPSSQTMGDLSWMNVNMSQIGSNNATPLFANIVDQSRGYASDGGYGVMASGCDSSGNPQVDCNLIINATQAPGITEGNINVSGTYKMQWTGASGAITGSGTGWSIANKVTVGSVTTADLVITDPSQNVTPQIHVPMSNLKIMRPGLLPSFTGLINPDALDFYSRFGGMRCMKASGVERPTLPEATYTLTWSGGGTIAVDGSGNYTLSSASSPSTMVVNYGSEVLVAVSGTINGFTVARSGFPGGTYVGYLAGSGNYMYVERAAITWADRRLPSHREAQLSLAREASGYSVEEFVQLANELHARAGSKLTKFWFNIWHNADDTYITNYMSYVRDNLASGITAYFELSNECWNFIYMSTWYFIRQGLAEVAAGGSDLNFDGSGNQAFYGTRMYSRRAAAMSVIAQTVFGGSFGTRCKIVLGTWLSSPNQPLAQLYYLETIRGINIAATFHGLAVSPYCFITSAAAQHAFADGAAYINALDTEPTAGRPSVTAEVSSFQEVAGRFKIPQIAYEGGIGQAFLQVSPPIVQADLVHAATGLQSTAVKTFIKNLITDFINYSGQDFYYYHAGVGPDCLGMANNGVTNLNGVYWVQDSPIAPGYTAGPRLQALLDMVATTVPDDTSQLIRSRAPGTLLMANWSINDHQIIGALDSWLDFSSTVGNMILNDPATRSGRWVEIVFWCGTAGTYTVTPAFRCTGSTDYVVAMDNTTIHTYSGVNTGGSPAGSTSIAQAPISGVSLSKGWHTLRVTMTIATTGQQAGVGPTVIA